MPRGAIGHGQVSTSRCNVHHHGPTGAPRRRGRALSSDGTPKVTPDQHADEGGATSEFSGVRRGRRPRTTQAAAPRHRGTLSGVIKRRYRFTPQLQNARLAEPGVGRDEARRPARRQRRRRLSGFLRRRRRRPVARRQVRRT